MASPVNFPGANKTFTAPLDIEKEALPMPGYVPTPCVISKWAVNKEELEEIYEEGALFLVVMGHTLPPIFVGSKEQVLGLLNDMNERGLR